MTAPSLDKRTASEIDSAPEYAEPASLLELLVPVAQAWKWLLTLPLLIGIAVLAVTFAVAPTFTARTTVLPPQQSQGGAAAALASLGALAAISGSQTRTLIDQYASLLVSETVQDRLIERFDLMKVYRSEMRVDARRALERNVRVTSGKRDGLLTVEVDDESPSRAAAMANQHIEELRALTSQLALTEAQQRRVFFESQLKATRDKLTQAQTELQASGFNAGALRTEPRAAVEGYARLKAEVTGAEVRLQTLRRSLTDAAPEIQQQQSTLAALRGQLSEFGASTKGGEGADYVSKYREFKYQEALFELFSRQYELARLDESREGALIQVVDAAAPPERKSKPRRAVLAVAATLISFLLVLVFVLMRHYWHEAKRDPRQAGRMLRLRAALRGDLRSGGAHL